MLIESGSHAPGVCAADFGLAAGAALRVERADSLRPVLSDYKVFDSDAALFWGAHNRIMPGWSRIWIALTADLFDVETGSHRYPRLGSAMLIGVTSRAAPVTTYGGLSVSIDIGPLAWARLFKPSAESLRDCVTPLDQLLPKSLCDELVSRVARTDRGPRAYHHGHPGWYLWISYRNGLLNVLRRQILDFVGLKVTHMKTIGPVRDATPEGIAASMDMARKLAS